jgi:hypothetical protein
VTIERYDYQLPNPEGTWVRYEDHAAALAEARAECERLREDRITELDVRVRFAERAEAAEAKLAAAEAECERLRELLASAQPAAPARSESMQAQSTSEFALAGAEQRVLDACAGLNVPTLGAWRRGECEWPSLTELAEAELARRGLKP